MKRTKLLLLILSGFSFIFSLSAANLVVGDYGGMLVYHQAEVQFTRFQLNYPKVSMVCLLKFF